MTDTPRCYALDIEIFPISPPRVKGQSYLAMRELAFQLERELNQAREEIRDAYMEGYYDGQEEESSL